MHTLRILGGFALDEPTEATGRRLSQRRAEAVLAVLAVTGHVGCTRGRLVGLFWPESTEALARHSLRDELYIIRQALDADAILAEGDVIDVYADGGEVFEALVLAGEPLREPVARYGPFVMNTKQEIVDAFEWAQGAMR